MGAEDPATIRLERVLNSAWDVERSVRRVVDGELADVRDHGEAVRPVHPVDSVDITPADVPADERDQHLPGIAEEGDVHRPPHADDRLRQAARGSRGGP